MWVVLLLHCSSSPAAPEVKKCWSQYGEKTQRCSEAVLFTMPNITAPWVQYDWPCSVGLVFFWKALFLDTIELKTVKWNTSFEWHVKWKGWGRDVQNTQEHSLCACVALYSDAMPLNSTGPCPWKSSWHCKAGCCWLGMSHTHRNFNWKQSCLWVIWHALRKRSIWCLLRQGAHMPRSLRPTFPFLTHSVTLVVVIISFCSLWLHDERICVHDVGPFFPVWRSGR